LESNWRWNVAFMGMAYAGIELFARWNTPLPGELWLAKNIGENAGGVWRYSASLGIFAAEADVGPFEPGFHYPWDFDVDPDQ